MRQTAYTVAIVGPDGSGKTTQATLLVERLQSAGYDARYVHVLYYLSDRLPFANRLRSKFGPRKTRTDTSEAMGPWSLVRQVLFGIAGFWFALLTIAAVTLKYRNTDQILVFDRYYQQFFYDVYGPASVRLSQALPQPCRTIYLEADLATVQSRVGPADSAAEAQYYATVIELFTDCATPRWTVLRAELPVETLHNQIIEAIGFGDGLERQPESPRPR